MTKLLLCGICVVHCMLWCFSEAAAEDVAERLSNEIAQQKAAAISILKEAIDRQTDPDRALQLQADLKAFDSSGVLPQVHREHYDEPLRSALSGPLRKYRAAVYSTWDHRISGLKQKLAASMKDKDFESASRFKAEIAKIKSEVSPDLDVLMARGQVWSGVTDYEPGEYRIGRLRGDFTVQIGEIKDDTISITATYIHRGDKYKSELAAEKKLYIQLKCQLLQNYLKVVSQTGGPVKVESLSYDQETRELTADLHMDTRNSFEKGIGFGLPFMGRGKLTLEEKAD